MIDSFEFSKIAGGVLAALLVIFLPKTFIDMARQGHGPIEGGFALPAPEAGGAAPDGGAEAPAAAFDPAQIVSSVAGASAENGAGVFKKCATCHSSEKGAASKAGPNLWGVLGRPHGSLGDFKGYSEAMKSKGGDWTYVDLASFLHKPKEFVPGTKMIFAGIPDTAELADLIAYIRTLSDSPPPLPEAAAPAAQPAAPAQPESPAPAPQ